MSTHAIRRISQPARENTQQERHDFIIFGCNLNRSNHPEIHTLQIIPPPKHVVTNNGIQELPGLSRVEIYTSSCTTHRYQDWCYLTATTPTYLPTLGEQLFSKEIPTNLDDNQRLVPSSWTAPRHPSFSRSTVQRANQLHILEYKHHFYNSQTAKQTTRRSTSSVSSFNSPRKTFRLEWHIIAQAPAQ